MKKLERMVKIIEKATDLEIEFEADVEEITKPGDEDRKYKMLPECRFKITGKVG